jgi:hypothetical protein
LRLEIVQAIYQVPFEYPIFHPQMHFQRAAAVPEDNSPVQFLFEFILTLEVVKIQA